MQRNDEHIPVRTTGWPRRPTAGAAYRAGDAKIAPQRENGIGMEGLAARVLTLEALEAIRALKARYSALADAKYTQDYERVDAETMGRVAAAQAACFSEDAVWAAGDGFGGDLIGRAALHQWFKRAPWRFAIHYYTSESIDVDAAAGTAEAYWRLMQVAVRDDTARAVWLGAVTHERYVLDPDSGEWLTSFMRFTDLHMMELADTALPIARDFAGLDARRRAFP
ncbi:nuclear transport factor 2 family protein [Robbsia sp. KACC 23696]|uniref:nuclear transport factor 2 family protein n=1 Tax=Robbsia sp. KACC 23696 TaxID=3149231 RepID=UPI00325B7799